MATQVTTSEHLILDKNGVERARPYAFYALFVLSFANLFNYLDRHIVAVLSPAIQAELGFSDADIGFLLGTAFAVLYGVLGIPMGRIADSLSRTKLMAAGLSLWSSMTALSGAANSFGALAATRIGVGVGEATANPVSHSLLCDYFPARNRAAVLGTYLASVHLGIATSLILGGLLINNWDSWCTAFPGGACGLTNWRAGFLLVGIPGIFLAILIFFLREPPRPKGHKAPPAAKVIKEELSAAIPPFTFFSLKRLGGVQATISNIGLLAVLIIAAIGIAVLTGDWAQWIAVGIGAYSVATWAHVLKLKDTALYALTFGCRTFMYSMFGGAFLTCFVGTLGIWAAPYAIRTFSASNAGEIGLALGAAQFGTAVTSVIIGGLITDWWKKRDLRAPIWVAMISLFVPIPLVFILLRAETLGEFIPVFCALTFFAMLWAGSFAALVQDLVIQRMRAVAAAIFSLVMILTSSGIGPYWAGKISTITGSLTTGLYSLLGFVPVALILLLLAAKRMPHETAAARQEMAWAAGEPRI